MKLKTIVLSCGPVLNEAQTKGFSRLITVLEKRNFRVVYYGSKDNTEFNRYAVNQLSFNKLLYKIPFYWVWLRINRTKWLCRLKRNLPPTDAGVVDMKALKGAVRMAVQYFCSVKPAIFICWNPHSPTFGIWADTARMMGIAVPAIEGGLLPGTFILDKDGTLAASKLFNRSVTYSNPHKFSATGESIYKELNQKSLSLYQQATEALPEELLNTRSRNTKVLLIGIDMVDSGAMPHTDPDRLGLLPFHKSCTDQALAIASSDPDFKVVLKPHPSHNDHPQSDKLSSNCWVINSNPDDLIAWADVIVCSGSKMEFSAILAGKPLVTVGAGILYGKGCSYEVTDPLQLPERIKQARKTGITPEQLNAFKLFLGYLHDDYLYVYNQPHENNDSVIDRIIQHTGVLQ